MVNILKSLIIFYNKLFNKKEKKEVVKEYSKCGYKNSDDEITVKTHKPSDNSFEVEGLFKPPTTFTYKFPPLRPEHNINDYIRDINGEECYEKDIVIFNHEYIILTKDHIMYAKKNIKIIKAEKIDLNYYIIKETNTDE